MADQQHNPAAVRVCAIADIQCSRGCGTGPCKREAESLQPAAAPIAWYTDWPGHRVYAAAPHGWDEPGLQLSGDSIKDAWHPLYAVPAPSPADERAAFEAWWTRDVPDEHKASAYALLKQFGDDYAANKRCAEAWKVWQARAASANETGAEAFTYATKQATACAGCGEHKHTPLRIDWMGGYVCLTCIDRELESRSPAQAAEAVAIPAGWLKLAESARSLRSLYHNTHCNPKGFRLSVEALADEAAKLLAAPQPAQADARVGLTDDHRDAIDYAIQVLQQVEAGDGTFVGQCADAISGLESLLAAHPGQPEPRAEVTEEQPSLTNPLTPYGMLVRALRIVAGTTLMDMAQHLGRGPAELSAIEFGRKPVRDADIVDAAHFFACVGIQSTTHALTIAARTGASS